MKVTGVVQAGGKSTRMGGQPKALMELGGARIIERVVRAVQPAVNDLLIVTNTPESYAFLGLPMVPDAFPDSGSLGGIYSGLKATSSDAVFTVACDMPFLKLGVIRLVVDRADEGDVVIPLVGGQYETLHACYHKRCLVPMEERLRQGRLKIIEFFDRVRVVTIDEAEIRLRGDPSTAFMNVNTPAELERARALAGQDDP